MSGPEFIRALRGELDSSAPPIVLMTAANVRYAQDAGADSSLRKPFEVTTVEALLRHFLEIH